MKKIIYPLSIIILLQLTSCDKILDYFNEPTETDKESEAKGSKEEKQIQNKEKTENFNQDYKYLLGKWYGILRDKELTIVIESIDGSSVIGYNIAGKNNRPLIGTIYEDDRMGDGECGGEERCYKLVLSEPGDDKWDGVFTLYLSNCPNHDDEGNIIDGSYSSGNGSWKANSGKLSGEISLVKN